MSKSDLHTFHIPVMGLGYTIDTPLKVARFGIASVVSIIEDGLVEAMRKHHSALAGEEYVPIHKGDEDHRARRITAYLNLLHRLVKAQFEALRRESFDNPDADLVKYFDLLPDSSPVKALYGQMREMQAGEEKAFLQDQLRERIRPGAIDVNIMTKCDRMNVSKAGIPLPPEFADAMAALRGFALSDLDSSVVFSAGLNPRLYTYCETFEDFYPKGGREAKKKIILKVSDFRSALIQGKMFAKKGLWVSEYRIESGLNCGGHAFPTNGLLMGPILEEFRSKKIELVEELLEQSTRALQQKGITGTSHPPSIRITAQGGIGTAREHDFLLEHYGVDSAGWGSPFLLVPEVTNVDGDTLAELSTAKKEDYYLSYASPLGIPFNNFRRSSGEAQRKERIEKGRPGSACYKKHLSFNTEFGETAICTSSREYQHLKIRELEGKGLSEESLAAQVKSVTEKDCLCEGLAASAQVKNGIPVPHGLTAVTICPGPNLAYFSGVFTLQEMAAHIYGRLNLLNDLPRPNMFIGELYLYAEYLKREFEKCVDGVAAQNARSLEQFRKNLLEGIEYYWKLIPNIKLETSRYLQAMKDELQSIEQMLLELAVPTELVPLPA